MPVVGTNDDLRQASAPVGKHGWSCRTGGVRRQNVLRTVPVAALAEVSAFGSEGQGHLVVYWLQRCQRLEAVDGSSKDLYVSATIAWNGSKLNGNRRVNGPIYAMRVDEDGRVDANASSRPRVRVRPTRRHVFEGCSPLA